MPHVCFQKPLPYFLCVILIEGGQRGIGLNLGIVTDGALDGPPRLIGHLEYCHIEIVGPAFLAELPAVAVGVDGLDQLLEADRADVVLG